MAFSRLVNYLHLIVTQLQSNSGESGVALIYLCQVYKRQVISDHCEWPANKIMFQHSDSVEYSHCLKFRNAVILFCTVQNSAEKVNGLLYSCYRISLNENNTKSLETGVCV